MTGVLLYGFLFSMLTAPSVSILPDDLTLSECASHLQEKLLPSIITKLSFFGHTSSVSHYVVGIRLYNLVRVDNLCKELINLRYFSI